MYQPISQIKKLAIKGFRIVVEDCLANVIREWDGERFVTIKHFQKKHTMHREMKRLLHDVNTIRG